MKVSSNSIQALAQSVGKGNQQALSELYHLAYPQLYRYGLKVIGNQAAEVFLKEGAVTIHTKKKDVQLQPD
jgi:hypothetical protein